MGRFVLIGLALSASPLLAATATINFEGFPDGAVLTNQYSGAMFSNALILTAGISLNEFEFPPHSGVNVVSDNGGPMTIEFSAPVLSFGGYFTYLDPLRIDAFTAANDEVASAKSVYSNNLACLGGAPCLGDPGSSPNELIQVAFEAGISHVTITGTPAGSSFALDDITYTRAAAPVPEPSSLVLCQIAGILAATYDARRIFARRRASRIWVRSPFILVLVPTFLFANPSISATSAAPTVVPVNANTSVTFTARIADPSVIPGSVFLIQYDAPGIALRVLGRLHDDGLNGDAKAGDGIYTIVTRLPDATVGPLILRVSAAFSGVLRRVLSDAITIRVTQNITFSEPNTHIRFSVPNFGVPARAVYQQPNGDTTNTPYIDIQVWDKTRSAYTSAFEIVFGTNSSELTLDRWFEKNVDDQNASLITNGTFVPRFFDNGDQALLFDGQISSTYEGFPVENGYVMLPNDLRVFSIAAGDENPLYALGYSSDEVSQFAQQLLASITDSGAVSAPQARQLPSRKAHASTSTPCHNPTAPACGTPLNPFAVYQGESALSNGCDMQSKGNCAGRGPYGSQYQCVEFVKRAMSSPTNGASKAWSLHYAREYWSNYSSLGLDRHLNGAADAPQVGDIIVWGPIANNNQLGHLDIVIDAQPASAPTIIKVAEQNWSLKGTVKIGVQHVFGNYFIAPRTVTHSDGTETVRHALGWLRLSGCTACKIAITGQSCAFIGGGGTNSGLYFIHGTAMAPKGYFLSADAVPATNLGYPEAARACGSWGNPADRLFCVSNGQPTTWEFFAVPPVLLGRPNEPFRWSITINPPFGTNHPVTGPTVSLSLPAGTCQ